MESSLFSPASEGTADTFTVDVGMPLVSTARIDNVQRSISVYNDGYLDDLRWQKAYSKLRRASAIM